MSSLLKDVELRYPNIEKQAYYLVKAIKKFKHYITGYQTFVHIDHATIRYLINKPDVNARIIRWLLLLQQFDLTIIDKLGKENVVADFLSRVNLTVGEEGMVDDQCQMNICLLSQYSLHGLLI